ncbi:SDR family oxidoreductase [Pseudomonas sp. B2M1-30]|uniref:SDR family oxidoreductase n=1 Tax=Pseudomonas TaxID=286 RepID=UPI0021C890EF|nr:MULTISPECIES: SDR family oxidoreductase [Pseudomonas]MCU0119959.1 SDR family oxidoreductase [Pseudomonas sp. B2M1-30]MCU7261970.1 SDR family oxidoreductase [Pseudomonas koreensis]
MSQVILVTGASSGFGAMSVRALADSGHVVYASMRDTSGRNAPQVEAVNAYATEHGVHLRALELDVQSQPSAEAAIECVIAEQGRIDVLMHNAGHMVFGSAEAFMPEQYAQLYDINVLGTQRVNRVALPYMRRQRHALMLWIGSSSHRGGTPPYLAPYFAAKAAMDSLAVSYAGELARWGIETSIVVPGAFTQGTNHFIHAGKPADAARQAEYDNGPTRGLADEALKSLAACEPQDADPTSVARAIVDVVNAPFGHRPFRVHVDPSNDGCAVVAAVADRIRAEFLRRIQLGDLLSPHIN